MMQRNVSVLIAVAGVVIAVAGLFNKITYHIVSNHVNGLLLGTTPYVVTNYWVSLLGVAIFFFGLHGLWGSEGVPVTVVDEEMVKKYKGEEGE